MMTPYAMTAPFSGMARPIPIFRWTGQYAGFITDDWFFDANARYLGWREADGTIWKYDGAPIGQIVDDHYILRNLRLAPPVRRTPRVPPVPPTPPYPPGPRLPRIPKPGWVDPLETLLYMPSRENLIGEWTLDQKQLSLHEGGVFIWSDPGQAVETGFWELRSPLLAFRSAARDDPAATVLYRIIEFTGTTLTLRWHTPRGRSLLFTLRRIREPDQIQSVQEKP